MMTKNKLIIFVNLLLFSFVSCSNDVEDSILDSEVQTVSIYSVEDLKKNIDNINSELKAVNPQNYEFEDTNSEFFTTEECNFLRNSNQIYEVSGYDKRTILRKYNLTFYFPVDPKVVLGVPYYTELSEYIKYIEAPKGYSVVIPPANPPILVRSSLPGLNMGYIPDNFFIQGYSVRMVSVLSNKIRYALVTHVEEIIKNTRNNKTLSPPVYRPDGVVNPSAFRFKYQLKNVSWD